MQVIWLTQIETGEVVRLNPDQIVSYGVGKFGAMAGARVLTVRQDVPDLLVRETPDAIDALLDSLREQDDDPSLIDQLVDALHGKKPKR